MIFIVTFLFLGKSSSSPGFSKLVNTHIITWVNYIEKNFLVDMFPFILLLFYVPWSCKSSAFLTNAFTHSAQYMSVQYIIHYTVYVVCNTWRQLQNYNNNIIYFFIQNIFIYFFRWKKMFLYKFDREQRKKFKWALKI